MTRPTISEMRMAYSVLARITIGGWGMSVPPPGFVAARQSLADLILAAETREQE